MNWNNYNNQKVSVILNIETSADICSVAVSNDGNIEFHVESDQPMQHARLLAPFVERALEDLTRKQLKPDAIAVSIGPGSYTGLRIGMSMAKGLCYSLDIPMIGIGTLELLAVKGMFGVRDPEGDEVLVSMIDARRKEVYLAAYDFALNEIITPHPHILDIDSLRELAGYKKVIVTGNGGKKAKELIDMPNVDFLSYSMPVAMDMVALSERAFRQGKFMDAAYGVPVYLKDYDAKHSSNKVLDEARSHSDKNNQ